MEDNTEANTTATADDVIEVIDTRDLTETADVTTYAEDELATEDATTDATTHTDVIVPAITDTPEPVTTVTEDTTIHDMTHTDVIVPDTANTPEPATTSTDEAATHTDVIVPATVDMPEPANTDLNQPSGMSNTCSEVNGQQHGLTFKECGSKSITVWAYTESFGTITPETVRKLEEMEEKEGKGIMVYCVWQAGADQNSDIDYIASLVEAEKQKAMIEAKDNEKEDTKTNKKGDFSSVGETINAQFGRLIRA